MSSLTRRGIARMLNYDGFITTYEAKVQIIHLKRIIIATSVGVEERYRVILSDGNHYILGLLHAKFNTSVRSERIKQFTIIQLEEIAVNTIHNKKLCVLLECHVLRQIDYAIGAPRNVEKAIKKNVSQGTRRNISNRLTINR